MELVEAFAVMTVPGAMPVPLTSMPITTLVLKSPTEVIVVLPKVTLDTMF